LKNAGDATIPPSLMRDLAEGSALTPHLMEPHNQLQASSFSE